MKTQTFINRISYLPKTYLPLARDEVFARLQSYNLCWSKYINDWRDYDQSSIKLWHEPWYNEAELCRELHCTEEEAKFLIKNNPVIFTAFKFFSLAFMILWVWKDTNQWMVSAWFLYCDSAWTLLQCLDKFENSHEVWASENSFSSKNQM